MTFIYKYFLKPILFLFDPEKVHTFFIVLGEKLGQNTFSKKLTSLFFRKVKRKIVTIDGINYYGRVLLSAGFDTDGRLVDILPNIGFAGEEIGSITAKKCEGNKSPTLTRLKKTKSIQVYKGLRNNGVEALIKKLKNKKQENFILGISIARTNNSSNANLENSIDDYLYSYKRLNEEKVGDYYTINISCPNAFSGEIFLNTENLQKLLDKLSEIKCEKPVYIKMPINLQWKEFKKLTDIIKQYNVIKGIVIGNLDKSYNNCHPSDKPHKWRGGLSGKPCKELSNNLIQKTKEIYGNRFTIIGAGGIFSADDAVEKIKAGADLIQIITGMIFEGPWLINKINKKLKDTKL